MDCLAQITSEKYSNPIEFLNQLRQTTEPIGGGMEYTNDGEYVDYDVAVEAVKKAQKQFINKAIEYIKIHTLKTMSSRDIHNIIVDFKQVMEGE
jgi:hypothetical protein